MDSPEALAADRLVPGDVFRGQALVALAPHLSPDLLTEALTAADAIGRRADRVRALAGLVDSLSAGQRPGVLRQALDALKGDSLPDEKARTGEALDAAARIDSSAPADRQPVVLDQALAAARAIQYGGGSAAIKACADAICDVDRWWP